MQAVDAYGRHAQAVVLEDAHQLGQRGRAVGAGADGGAVGRHQRVERIAEPLPRLVDLLEGLDFEHLPDALVLGALAVRFQQPLVDLDALGGAGLVDLRERRLRMLAQIGDQPQLERMQPRDVAAVGQVEALRPVLVVELGDGRRIEPGFGQVGADEGRQLVRPGLRIERAEKGRQAHRRRVRALHQDRFLLLRALASVFAVEASHEEAALAVGEALEVALPLRGRVVFQRFGAGAGQLVLVVA